MLKLIIPDVQPDLLDLGPYNLRVEQICLVLEARHPDWLRLDEDLLLDITNRMEEFKGKTFIIPDRLVSSRRHMTKVNRLVTYMCHIARRFNWSFVVIAPGRDKIDSRARVMLDEVENW